MTDELKPIVENKPRVRCDICGKECINLNSHMKAHKDEIDNLAKQSTPTSNTVVKSAKQVIIKDVEGEEVDPKDYFFGGEVPSGFLGTCGNPVDREELIAVFNKVFKPKQKYLFYKSRDKEVYLVIVPLKYATSVGVEQESATGDFQKHAISFINEGSVNLDTLRQKLDIILKFVKRDED